MLGFLQLFSGGALTQFAVFALGIMPYITASIIMQILARGDPEARAVAEAGRGRPAQDHPVDPLPHDRASRSLQATGLAFLFHNGGGGVRRRATPPDVDLVARTSTLPRVLLVVLTLTAGTALLMWMGELITQRGIGNGMSLLIFASVVSTLPFQSAADPGRGAAASCSASCVLAVDRDPRRHRVRRAGPAPHPGAVRQAGGRPAHVRRPEHLHPAQGQPGRRHPDHLRQLGAVPAGAARRTSLPSRAAGATRPAFVNDYLRATPTDPVHLICTACSSSASRTSTRPSPSTRPSRPTTSASRVASSPASGPGPRPSATSPRS